MDVRSLAIAIGFKVNHSNVKQVEQTTKKVKQDLNVLSILQIKLVIK